MTRAHKHKAVSNRQNILLDKLIFIAAVVEPLFLFPQAYELFHHKNAESVFIPTWIGINALIAIWIWYAIVNKQRMLLIYQVLFFIANSLIIIAGIIYGGSWS